jgi:hypothetical protein
MKKVKNMALIIIIVGVIIIAGGTLVSWYGQSLKSSEELAVIRHESGAQTESLKSKLKQQEEQIADLSSGNKELLAVNNSLKQTIDVQTSLISKLKEETERLRNLGNEQLRTIYYTEELNQEVKALFVRFKLKESVDFSDLCPMKFGIQFSSPNHTPINFRKLVTDFEIRDDAKNRLCAFQVFNVSQEDNPKITNSFKDLHKNSKISFITIQIFVTNNMKGIVRDFHDEMLLTYFPKDLYQKIESIQLIVNGWIILNEDFENVDWRIDKSPWLSLIESKAEMYQPINKGPHDRPPSAQWTINLYNKLPEYAKEWSSTQWFGSLVEGLDILYR